jgi:hypothetical protein
MSYYQDQIRETAARLGHIGVNARHVEAWMRSERGTLDHLTPAAWVQEVRECIAVVDHADPDLSERLARSYGL